MDRYVLPIQSTLSCVTEVPLVFSSSRHSRLLQLHAPNGALLNGTGLKLRFAQGFSPCRGQDGTWKVRTEAYIYILTDEQDRPMVEYHWHPQKEYLRKRPHFHIKHGSTGQGTSGLRQGLRKAHFPSGRIAIEEIARFLITEMRVRPRFEEWDDMLSKNLQDFESYRSWP